MPSRFALLAGMVTWSRARRWSSWCWSSEGEARKLLRVTLPLGMSLQAGTRVIIDNGQPLTGPYVICLANGCVAEYEASAELIPKMKTGQSMHVQGINGSGQPISIPMPLADFAKAYDGPPIDPK